MNEWMPCVALDREAPAPRKRRKRRHVGQRIARIIGLALALLVLSLVVRKIVRPFQLCYLEARSVNEVQHELKRVEADNSYLRKQRAYLASHEGARIEARKLGWVMPGERNIVLENAAENERPADSKDADGQGFWRRLTRHFRL